MSDKKTSSARYSLKIDEFDGIDSGAKHKNPRGSAQIVNFRIDNNGSLKKRCGFKTLLELEDDIDGVWYGKLFGSDKLIIVSRSTIYENTDNGFNIIGQIDHLSDSEFNMFYYNDCLYFINRRGMYQLNELGLSTPICYPPLIGKDWDCGWIGEMNEKKNLLSDYVRISYLIQENPVKFLRLTEPVERVVAIHKNDTLLSSSDYTLDNNNMAIILNDIKEGDRFVVTLKCFESTDPLAIDARSAARCTLLGGIEKKRPYLWGCANEDTIYVCKHITTEQKNDALKSISCVPFYVTEDDIIKVGTSNHKVRAITKHLGRTLIFTENDAWRSSEEGEAALESDDGNIRISDIAPIIINTAIGVRTVNGVVLADNDPISIGNYSLFRWTSNTDELDEQNAYPISSEIDTLLTDKFRANSAIYYDRKRKEIYLYSISPGAKLWIWKKSSGKWVRFEGVAPTYIFEYGDDTAFVSGNVICVFDEALTQDQGFDINAYFTSNPIDFDDFGDKHMSAVKLRATGSVTLKLFYNGNEIPDGTFELRDVSHGISKRITSKRFRFAEIQLSAGGNERQSIHSVELTAR